MSEDIPLCLTCGKQTEKILGEIATCNNPECPDMHLYSCRDGAVCKVKESDLNHPDLQ